MKGAKAFPVRSRGHGYANSVSDILDSRRIGVTGSDRSSGRRAIYLLTEARQNERRTKMCNLYSITTNQAAIIALFRVMNRYVGNLPPMPGVFPDYPAPVIREADGGEPLPCAIQ